MDSMTAANETHPDYDRLPEAIKSVVTPKEFAWLGDEGRETILDDACYPDIEED